MCNTILHSIVGTPRGRYVSPLGIYTLLNSRSSFQLFTISVIFLLIFNTSFRWSVQYHVGRTLWIALNLNETDLLIRLHAINQYSLGFSDLIRSIRLNWCSIYLFIRFNRDNVYSILPGNLFFIPIDFNISLYSPTKWSYVLTAGTLIHPEFWILLLKGFIWVSSTIWFFIDSHSVLPSRLRSSFIEFFI